MSGRPPPCPDGRIAVSGRDITRITRQLAVEPWQFADIVRTRRDDPDGIALDAGPHRHRLVLQRDTDGDCVFLLRMNDGTARCGLGALRPATCGGDASDEGFKRTIGSWNDYATRSGRDGSFTARDVLRYVLDVEVALQRNPQGWRSPQ
jgi:hypothetical protein